MIQPLIDAVTVHVRENVVVICTDTCVKHNCEICQYENKTISLSLLSYCYMLFSRTSLEDFKVKAIDYVYNFINNVCSEFTYVLQIPSV